jgi:hypothetical protein
MPNRPVYRHPLCTPSKPLLGLALALALPWAQAQESAIDWSRATQTPIKVLPAQVAEACGRIILGRTVHWAFRAEQPMAFNVHYHVGKSVQYPVPETQADQASGTLRAARTQTYCWMWKNTSSKPALIKFKIERQARAKLPAGSAPGPSSPKPSP